MSKQNVRSNDNQNSAQVVTLPLMLHGKEFPVNEDEGAFSNFFLDKITKSMKQNHPESDYELEKNESGEVTSVIWRNVGEAQKKELEDALDWSLRKVEENRKANIKIEIWISSVAGIFSVDTILCPNQRL
jgi:hypothetical protein